MLAIPLDVLISKSNRSLQNLQEEQDKNLPGRLPSDLQQEATGTPDKY